MTTNLRVTIVAANTTEHDARLRRTAAALAGDGHEVTIVGLGGPGLPPQDRLPDGVVIRRIDLDRRLASAFRPLPARLRSGLARRLGIDPDATVLPPETPAGLGRVPAAIRRFVEIIANVRRTGPWREAVLAAAPGTDVFHAKALIALPVIRGAARKAGGRFVYDVADFHTEAARLSRMPGIVRWLLRRSERTWVREAAGLTAVSEAVAAEVSRRYRVASPTLLLNTPSAWQPDEPGPPADDGRLRRAAGLPPERRIVLYQGAFSIDRGVEELVAALDEPVLRDRDLAVVLLGFGRLRDGLLEAAATWPGRLVVLDPVPPSELVGYTIGADVSYVGQPPRTLNQRLNLANKLFESLMAGVPVVVADGTEHCRFVTREGVGACAEIDRPAAVAEAIAGLLDLPADQRGRLRGHCRTLALERYTWEIQQAGLVGLYRRLADGAGAAR
jgi:glycosyltransferase involved in cell wall biosynthesis